MTKFRCSLNCITMKRMTKCMICLGVFGLVFLIAGCVLIPVLKNYIRSQIKETIPLKEGTDTYNTWLDPPVPIYFQIYVLDLQNPIEVVKHGAKPSFIEKGPYTYREHRAKWQINSYDNGTLSYRENRSFVFEREKSVSSHEDKFTTANLILVTIADIIRREYSLIQELVEFILEWGNDSNLFTTLSVKDIMWGYEDPLLKKFKSIVQKYDNKTTFDDKFGLFYKQNGSDDGLYTIFSGTKSSDNFGAIQRWNRETTLPYWTTPTCNMINGSDGTIFPPFEDKGNTLYIFSSDICRSIYTVYQKAVTLKGIDLMRFAVPPKVFLNHKQNPDNEGFCTPPGQCLPSGLLNVSSCRQGAPIIMSQPHFLAADKKLVQDQVIGLSADPNMHGTVLDVEPMTGVVMNAQKRLQLNVYIRNVSHIRLDSYQLRKKGSDEIAVELVGELTNFEKELLKRQQVVEIRGKTGRGVPVILPEDVQVPMEYLADNDVRLKAGINECNVYLFANSQAGVFRAYDAIRITCDEAGLKNPGLVKSSNLRKYMATMLQSLDTTENERQWVVDHLGHTMKIHLEHYRQTSDVLERVEIAKLLLIQDMGLVSKYRGKQLSDIQLNGKQVQGIEKDTANIDHIYYPVLWLNESAVIDDKSANKFKSEVMTPIKITEAVEYGLIVLGAFMIICTAALCIKQRVSRRPEDDLEDVHHSTNTSEKSPLLK